jgi:RNA polymerase sigma factor (sigma-70 family)
MALTLSLTPLAPARSEHDLVAAARNGDDRAFEALYSRYRERIAAFIVSKVHDHARGEDIAQDVFMSALRRLRASDQEIVFKPWIYEIAKNACIDEFRRTKRAREVSLEADEETGGDRRALLSLAPTPPAAVESKQRLDDLQGAFGVLSENHHKLLVMREFEGLSYTEIGARTGMSRQMVESTLFRARRKLTEEYDEIASGRRCQQVQALIDEGRAQSARACGVRQRRQLTRHLAYCQSCRRRARLAGVDESFVKPRSIAAKIAALLPFPLWRWSLGGRGKAAKTGSHTLTKAGSVKGAAGAAGSAAPGFALSPAALTAAALAVAGVGGGTVAGVWSGHHPSRAAITARPASSTSSASSLTKSRSGLSAPAAVAGGTAAAARKASVSGRSMSHSVRARPRPGGHAATHPGKSTPTSGPTGSTGGGSTATKSGSTRQPTISSVTGGAGRTVTGTAKSTVSGIRHVVSKTVHTGSGSVTSTVHKVTQTVKGALPSAGSTVAGVTGKAGSTVTGVTSKAGSTVTGVTSKAGSTVAGVTGKAGSTVTGVTGKAGSAVGGPAGGAVSSTGSTVGSTVGKAGSTVGSTVGKAGSTVGSTVGKTGSTVGGIASAAGSATKSALGGLG